MDAAPPRLARDGSAVLAGRAGDDARRPCHPLPSGLLSWSVVGERSNGTNIEPAALCELPADWPGKPFNVHSPSWTLAESSGSAPEAERLATRSCPLSKLGRWAGGRGGLAGDPAEGPCIDTRGLLQQPDFSRRRRTGNDDYLEPAMVGVVPRCGVVAGRFSGPAFLGREWIDALRQPGELELDLPAVLKRQFVLLRFQWFARNRAHPGRVRDNRSARLKTSCRSLVALAAATARRVLRLVPRRHRWVGACPRYLTWTPYGRSGTCRDTRLTIRAALDEWLAACPPDPLRGAAVARRGGGGGRLVRDPRRTLRQGQPWYATAPTSLLDRQPLEDERTRVLARAVGDHLPYELVLRADELASVA